MALFELADKLGPVSGLWLFHGMMAVLATSVAVWGRWYSALVLAMSLAWTLLLLSDQLTDSECLALRAEIGWYHAAHDAGSSLLPVVATATCLGVHLWLRHRSAVTR